jgi:fibronectin type 3 domain-containing protein
MKKFTRKLLIIYFYVAVLVLSTISLPVSASGSLPTSVTVVSTNYTTLNVSWTATDLADGYLVFRSTSATGSYVQIQNTTELSYSNTGLSYNTSYYYKVQPYFVIDSIAVPGTLSAYGTAKTALANISSLAVVSTGYASLRVTWAAVSGASGYQVYRSIGNSTTYTLMATQTALVYNNTYLATNTKYNYKIRAYRTVGTTRIYGAYSNVVSGQPIPSAPLNVSVKSTGYNSLLISWSAVSGAYGYEVSTSLSENGTYTILPLTTKTSVSLTNQSTNVPLYVKLRTYRTVGLTKIYSLSTTAVYGTPIPSTPTLTVVSNDYQSLRISWPSIAGASAYDLYRYDSGSLSYELLENLTGLSYLDVELISGVTYSYKVVAYRMVDSTKVESLASAVVSGKPIPVLVTNFKVAMPGITFINLSWSAVSGATGYEISRSTSTTGVYALVTSVEGSALYTNTGLTFNRTYYYKIRAYRTVNSIKVYGPTSTYISAKTIPSTSTLTVNNPSSTTNTLSWTSIAGVSGYELAYSKGTSTTYYLLKTTVSTTFTHTGLTRNTKYNYKVRAYKLYGTTKIYGAYSSIQSIIAQYSTNELLTLVSAQLSTAISKISNTKEKDILVMIKTAMDARKADPNYDYIAKSLEARILFSGLSINEKTHLMLTIIVYVNTENLLRLNELLPIN